MIRYKGEEVNLDKVDDPITKKFLALKDKLIAEYLGFPMVVKLTPNRLKKDADGKPMFPAVHVELKSTVLGGELAGVWQYYETSTYRGEKDIEEFLPARKTISGGKLVITEEYLDLAVFLRFLSPQCADNNMKKEKYFVFENRARENRGKMDFLKQETEIRNLLTSDKSPLSDDQIMALAQLYKIHIPFKASRDEISLSIYNIVQLMEQHTPGKGYATFLSDVKLDEITMMRSQVNQLFSSKIIVKDVSIKDAGVVLRYKLTKEEIESGTKKGREFLKIPKTVANEKIEDFAYDYLRTHEQERIELFKQL